MEPPVAYSNLQIILHWTIAALVLCQLCINRDVERVFDARMDGTAIEDDSWAILHVAIGLTVLLLVVVRLAVRLCRGSPKPPADVPRVFVILAHMAHFALYLLLLAMPITGATAWFAGSEAASEFHETGKTLIILVIILHVLGAFFEHFVLRNNALLRMLRSSPTPK